MKECQIRFRQIINKLIFIFTGKTDFSVDIQMCEVHLFPMI